MIRSLLYLLLCLLCHAVQAHEYTVGKGKQYATIKAAIAAADWGDTITVSPGIYREQGLVVDKTIYLRGQDYPILDGEHRYEILAIKAPGVKVQGFQLIASGVASMVDYAGIKIYDTHHVSILNNRLDSCFFGIYVQYSTHCIIRGNQLKAIAEEEQQSGNGIHCWKSDWLQIAENKVQGHRDGIYFEFVTNSLIWRNQAYRNMRYGLHFMFSNHDDYIENDFNENGAGVAVMFSNHVRMISNRFRENWGDASYGILLKEISDGLVAGNRFESNTVGILLEGVSRMDMRQNVFLRNGWALKMQASCMDITLSNNNFMGNTFDMGTNGSLVLNTFTHNYWDKYEGYDLNRNRVGDVPYRPVSVYSMIVERNPPAMMLFRSFMTRLLDESEKVIPSITPEDLKDDFPRMKPLLL
jgi:nitrous oxidase accessory protein